MLDLGPALGRNVQFLSPFVAKLFIADLHDTVRRMGGRFTFDGFKLDRILKDDLPTAAEGPVDLILAWDLLDYLDTQQIEILGKHLSRISRKESLVFLMLSTRPTVPDRPSRFLILDPETLRTENTSQQERKAPLYKEPDLEKLMPAFEVETSFLLRSGIQEYVLTTRSVL